MSAVDIYDDLEVKAKRANARAKQLASRLRAAGVYVSSVEDATLDTDAAVNLGEKRHVQVGVDGKYELVAVKDGAFTFEGATRSATKIVNQLIEELERFIKERVRIEPSQVFYCDKCGLFNPLEHLRPKDIEGLHLEQLADGLNLHVQFHAAECWQCGAWVSAMSPVDAAAISELTAR